MPYIIKSHYDYVNYYVAESTGIMNDWVTTHQKRNARLFSTKAEARFIKNAIKEEMPSAWVHDDNSEIVEVE